MTACSHIWPYMYLLCTSIPIGYEHTCHVCVYLLREVSACQCMYASATCECVSTCPSIGVSKVHVCTLGPQLHDHSIMAQGSGMMQRRAAGVVQRIDLHSGHPTQLIHNACMPLMSCHVQRGHSLHQTSSSESLAVSLGHTYCLKCIQSLMSGGLGVGGREGGVRPYRASSASLPDQLCTLLPS